METTEISFYAVQKTRPVKAARRTAQTQRSAANRQWGKLTWIEGEGVLDISTRLIPRLTRTINIREDDLQHFSQSQEIVHPVAATVMK
jgi:hypothetical protein